MQLSLAVILHHEYDTMPESECLIKCKSPLHTASNSLTVAQFSSNQSSVHIPTFHSLSLGSFQTYNQWAPTRMEQKDQEVDVKPLSPMPHAFGNSVRDMHCRPWESPISQYPQPEGKNMGPCLTATVMLKSNKLS